MPRLPPSLIRQASSSSALLPLLLRECRDLASARNELRWLKEHVSSHTEHSNQSSSQQHGKLLNYVHRRSKGEPLQYILGTQPFGDLEILCRKHVLIPRPETETYTAKVAQYVLEMYEARVLNTFTPLRIADLCSGSGCISLLLHSLLAPPSHDKRPVHNSEIGHESDARPRHIRIRGFEISPHALRLSNDNLLHGIAMGNLHTTAKTAVSFHHLDVLALNRGLSAPGENQIISSTASDFLSRPENIIISNPPYISPLDFAPGGTTTRSVREYEPKLALVPPATVPITASKAGDQSLAARSLADAEQADQFYHAVLSIAYRVGTELVVMEIGDSNQASRVRAIVKKIFENKHIVLETWLDDGSEIQYNADNSAVEEQRDSNRCNERAVVVWTGNYALWRKSTSSDPRV